MQLRYCAFRAFFSLKKSFVLKCFLLNGDHILLVEGKRLSTSKTVDVVKDFLPINNSGKSIFNVPSTYLNISSLK